MPAWFICISQLIFIPVSYTHLDVYKRQQVFHGEETLELKDIYVGDVWLCAGQSNMELPIARVKDFYPELSKKMCIRDSTMIISCSMTNTGSPITPLMTAGGGMIRCRS